MRLDDLVRFFETLTPQSLERFPEFYTADAWFKDPFNEVRGVDAGFSAPGQTRGGRRGFRRRPGGLG